MFKRKKLKRVLTTLFALFMLLLVVANGAIAFAASEPKTTRSESTQQEVSADNEEKNQPGQSSGLFTAESESGVSVSINAPDKSFNEPVNIKVCDVTLDSVTKTRVLSAADKERVLAAIDITFYNAAGKPVEPSKYLSVTISAATLKQTKNSEIVHVDTLDNGAVDFDSKPQQLDSHSTDSDTLVTKTNDFSIFAVVDSPSLLQYSFFDIDGKLISKQTVKEGDTLYEPSVPKTINNESFIGWFEQDSQTPFTSFGTVGAVTKSADINLTARYTNDTTQIIYYDTKGFVIHTETVPVNTTITISQQTPIIPVESLTSSHCGWSTTPGGADVSGSFAVGTEEVKLYPILLEGWWIKFQSNGGTAVTSQFISRISPTEDRKAQKPYDPYKEGYTFAGWYADEALSTPYDFNKTITDSTTIYAKWTPNDNTVYKVLYWMEYQSDIENDEWDYKLLARMVTQGTTGAKTEYDPDLIFKQPYQKENYGYVLNKEKSETKTIAPDGSTVINVYFDCQTRNISVTFPDRNGVNQTVSAENVKFSADMKFFWDKVAKYNDLDFLFDGHHEFLFSPYSISVNRISDLSSMSFYADETAKWIAAETNLARRTFYQVLENKEENLPEGKTPVYNTSARNIMRKGIEDGEEKYDDNMYYELDKRYLYGQSNKSFVPGNPEGFQCFYRRSDGNFWFNTSKVPVIWYHNTNGKGLDNETFAKDAALNGNMSIMYEYDNDPDGFMDVYYYRLQYDLNFHENGGAELENQKVYYEKNISVFDPAVTDPYHYTPGSSIRQNPDGQVLIFDGWYTDFALTQPFEGFDLTMPAYNIDLFAKWKPITYTVTFDSNGGSEVPPIKDVEYSKRVIEPTTPTYDGYKFLNWTLDDKIFNFESGITRDITLVAHWNSIDSYPVVYDLNGGTGTTPIDSNNYYADVYASVLPPTSDVKGPNGKVFLGWIADSDDQLYYPNSTVKMPKATLTLTAQWGEAGDPTDLTYDFNYSTYKITSYHTSGTEKTISGIENNSEITTADFSEFGQAPDGYSFVGWNMAADGSGKMIMPGDKLWLDHEEPQPNRIYAMWEKIDEPDKISIPVTKKWIGPETESITVKLFADGVDTKKEVILNKSNEWKNTFEDLDKYKDGVEINYTITEVSIDGYSSKITGNMSDGFVITNTNTETLNIPVEKKWVGEAAEAITIHLFADGKEIDSVKLTKAEKWKHDFKDLSKYDSKDGHEIKYTISEDSINGYKTTITGDMNKGFVITNTKITPPPSNTPKTSDESHMLLYLLATILSGTCLTIAFVIGRKKLSKLG